MSDYRDNYEVNYSRLLMLDGRRTSICADCWSGSPLKDRVRSLYRLGKMRLERVLTRLWDRLVSDPYYWVKYRTVSKFHVVDTGLEPGYYDKDHLMIHACFTLLVQFVEKEQPYYYDDPPMESDPEWDPKHYKEKTEIMELYNWWKNRPKGEHNYENSLAAHEEDQRQLHRLIDIRPRMWT